MISFFFSVSRPQYVVYTNVASDIANNNIKKERIPLDAGPQMWGVPAAIVLNACRKQADIVLM